jgi:hypothetical protein
MTTERKWKYYRKVYEQHYGPIPKDENGRTYHIHHIDGDFTNNDPSNLEAKSASKHTKDHMQDLLANKDLKVKHQEWSRKGGIINVKSGHLKRISSLGGKAQGPKNTKQLRGLVELQKKKVRVGNIIYSSQTEAGKAYGIVAASVACRVKSKHFPEWDYYEGEIK